MGSALVPTAGPSRQRVQRHVAGLVAALALLAVSVGLIAVGGLAAVARAGETYVDLGAQGTFESGQVALATDGTDWRTQLLGWAGDVRIEVASQDGKPIVLGVAPPQEVARLLSGRGHTTYAEHGGRGVVRTDQDGPAPLVAAMRRVHWTARAQGIGTETVRWKATDGPQAVLAMHADGSRPVRVRVVSSAVTLGRMPWAVPAAALMAGVVLLFTGVAVLRRAIRVRRSIRRQSR